jgi:outer membrane protein OmpA-like peptidoglycan-associated protein
MTMKNTPFTPIQFTPVLLAVALLLSACNSTPKTTSLLDQARSDYMTAHNNPKVPLYAASEIKQAGDALEQADEAATKRLSDEKIDNLAYLAKQKIAMTQEVASQRSAEADMVSAAKQRDQMRLDQRTMEANQAQRDAAQAQINASQANAVAEQSRLAAQAAQVETMEAQRQTQIAQVRTAQLDRQLAELSAQKTDRGFLITIGDVLFGTDKATLNPKGTQTAQKLADILQQNPQRTVLVEGFTDSTGSTDYNQALSERRATAVRNALQSAGINQDRIVVRGYGMANPVAPNDTAQNRQLNRRVEIILSDDSGKISSR